MADLAFGYRRTSTLPRRRFLVDFTANDEPQSGIHITAPDALAAEQLLRDRLNGSTNVVSFSIDLVREVVFAYNPDNGRYDRPVVRVPDWFTSRIVVNHR